MTQAKKLKFGDPAPPLAIATWLKGEPVERFEPGTVYVVEFWATGCGPCIREIPHLSQLQREHPDVVFIGVNCREDDDEKVAQFVKRQGEKMAYRVGIEQVREQSADANKAESNPRPVGVMGETWLRASGETGIPRAFVVDKNGRIAWIHHSAFLRGDTLKEVGLGTFDIAKAGLIHELNESLNEALYANDPDSVLAACDAYLTAPDMPPHGFLPLQFEAAIQKKDRVLVNKLSALILDVLQQKIADAEWFESRGHARWGKSAMRALLAGKFDFDHEAAAVDACERIAALSQTDDATGFFRAIEEFEAAYPDRVDWFSWDQWEMAKKICDGPRMNHYAKKIADCNDNPMTLNFLAWALIDPDKPIAGADFQLAKSLAIRSVELSERKNAGILDTAARACFLVGDLAQAVELQRLAVATCDNDDWSETIVAGMKACLETYLAAMQRASGR